MGNRKNCWLSLLIVTLLVSAGNLAYADPLGGLSPADIPTNINYGGIINTHDMMMLKEKERLKEQAEDFQNYQDRKDGSENSEEIIKDETGSGEKIYDAETSKKIKEHQKQLQDAQKKKKKRFFFNRKSKKSEVTETEPSDAAPDADEVSDDKKKKNYRRL